MIKELTLTRTSETTGEKKSLVLFNDEVNTFGWVVRCLIDVCEHSELQADQCAHIAHFKGKCSVLSGSYEFLEPRCTSLLDRGLSAEIV